MNLADYENIIHYYHQITKYSLINYFRHHPYYIINHGYHLINYQIKTQFSFQIHIILINCFINLKFNYYHLYLLVQNWSYKVK